MHVWRHREGARGKGKIQDPREREDEYSVQVPQEVRRERNVSPDKGDGSEMEKTSFSPRPHLPEVFHEAVVLRWSLPYYLDPFLHFFHPILFHYYLRYEIRKIARSGDIWPYSIFSSRVFGRVAWECVFQKLSSGKVSLYSVLLNSVWKNVSILIEHLYKYRGILIPYQRLVTLKNIC